MGLLLLWVIGKGQDEVQHPDTLLLTMSRSVELARAGNKNIQRARLQQQMADETTGIQKDLQTPDFSLHASYARITNLLEYHGSLSKTETIKAIPDMYELSGNMKVLLYAGKRIKTAIDIATEEASLARLKNAATGNDIHIKTIATYLGIYHLQSLQAVIQERIAEYQQRLKEVQALKKNGAVTKNEILRAQLQLSDMQLSLISNRRNIEIAIQELKTLLNVSEHTQLVLDTAYLSNMPLLEQNYEACLTQAYQKEEMQIARKEETLAQLERKEVKGNYYPTVALFGSWAYKYPDYMLFPPGPHLYRLGMIGVDATFNLSNLYKNKKHMALANKKVADKALETAILQDEITDQVHKEYVQLQEIKERIPVTETAIQQAEENYRIVKTKYLNQLALITDITDADNALLTARFSNIREKINAQMKYYQLLYATGALQQPSATSHTLLQQQ